MKKEIPSISVQSFDHFKKLTNSGNEIKRILFRGQNKDYDLRPGIARIQDKTKLRSIERKVFENFKSRYRKFPEYTAKKPKNDWDFLILAQHYGLKTRLLDWTDNRYVALWFATSLDIKNFGVVYTYEVDDNKIVKYADLPPDPFPITKSIAFKPEKNNSRIKHQSSWFTAHHFNEANYSLAFDWEMTESNHLKKLTIPISIFPRMRKELDQKKNITAEFLYNSVDKMCEDINKSFAPV